MQRGEGYHQINRDIGPEGWLCEKFCIWNPRCFRGQVQRKKQAEEQAKKDAEKLEALEEKITEIEATLKADPKDRAVQKELAAKKKELSTAKRNASRKKRDTGNRAVEQAKLSGSKIYARVSRRSFGNGSMNGC